MSIRILFVAREIAWPLKGGGDIRRWNILQGLRSSGTVDAINLRRRNDSSDLRAYKGCRQVLCVDHKHDAHRQKYYASTVGRGILTVANRLPFEYAIDVDEEQLARVTDSVDPNQYDLVFFGSPAVSTLFDGRFRKNSIVDGDDFAYVRNWHILRNSPWYGAKFWNYADVVKLWVHERSLHKAHAAVLRCSAADVERHKARNVHELPNGTTIPETIHREPVKNLLFVGDLGYVPNEQGLQWFIEQCWPTILEAEPGATLSIVGSSPPAWLSAFAKRNAGISVLGFVPSLKRHFETASCSIVPLLSGGGTRLKIAESLSYGVPVVSTSIGAFGIGASDAEGLVRDDDGRGFAEKCIRFLTDKDCASESGKRGRTYVKKHHDWHQIQRTMSELVDRLTT